MKSGMSIGYRKVGEAKFRSIEEILNEHFKEIFSEVTCDAKKSNAVLSLKMFLVENGLAKSFEPISKQRGDNLESISKRQATRNAVRDFIRNYIDELDDTCYDKNCDLIDIIESFVGLEEDFICAEADNFDKVLNVGSQEVGAFRVVDNSVGENVLSFQDLIRNKAIRDHNVERLSYDLQMAL